MHHHSPIVTKILRRLMPFLCLLYVVNYLDRTNVAMAKLRMSADIGLSESAYGLGAGLFFIGYFLFEVPSNLILQRVGARRWITRIMVSWGLVSAATLFAAGPASFGAIRLLLGIAEAGFFPGIVLYLTYWVPARHRGSVVAWFMTSTAVAGVIGTPLAGLLMKLDGAANLHGWQWLFLLEGLLPVFIGLAVWKYLPDGPADARWLSTAEKSWITTELQTDDAQPHHHLADLRTAIRSTRLWHLATLYFMMIMGLYGLSYWTPTMIRLASPTLTDVHVGLWGALPYLVAAFAMVLVGRHSDQTGERRRHVAACCTIAAVGSLAVALTRSHTLMMLALCLTAVGVFGTLGPFWALATRSLQGPAAAGSIAVVNSVGCLAGFVAPYAIGFAKQHTSSYFAGWALVAASLLCGTGLVLAIPAPPASQV